MGNVSKYQVIFRKITKICYIWPILINLKKSHNLFNELSNEKKSRIQKMFIFLSLLTILTGSLAGIPAPILIFLRHISPYLRCTDTPTGNNLSVQKLSIATRAKKPQQTKPRATCFLSSPIVQNFAAHFHREKTWGSRATFEIRLRRVIRCCKRTRGFYFLRGAPATFHVRKQFRDEKTSRIIFFADFNEKGALLGTQLRRINEGKNFAEKSIS